MHLEVPALDFQEMSGAGGGEESSAIKQRVDVTRILQLQRFADIPGIYCNSQMGARLQERYCRLDRASIMLLEKSVVRLGLSARAYNRVLKVARTIADMGVEADIGVHHVAEAVQFCRGDQ
jgi:magnesium chelatase family protein